MYYSSRQQTNAPAFGSSNVRFISSSANSSPRDSNKFGTRRPHASKPQHASAPPSPAAHSSPIRLPKSHIHRTPSEIQLAQELIKADYCERQMYARLVYGMSHHCEQKESEMHPLTVKSLRGVVNTHNQETLDDSDRHIMEHEASESDDWEVCYHDDTFKEPRKSVVSNDEEEEDECLFDLEM
jgi:hypothetical protein